MDPGETFRKVMGHFVTGVTVVTTYGNGHRFVPVDPPRPTASRSTP
jgi:flavin reductase (DIM6/NTAB) family NADH-FMN oxidoreductase RutF